MVEKFYIKPAQLIDMKSVFELSNEYLVRQNSFNSQKIDWNSHQNWFKSKIKDENYLFFVVKTENNELISQIRFDKTDNTISISVSKSFRGQGLGEKILKEASEIILSKENINVIKAYVKIENVISIKMFKKVGYIEKNILSDRIELEYGK